MREAVSRRGFVGGIATALGYLGINPDAAWARGLRFAPSAQQDEYDGLAKLANNENPYAPSETVMKAIMNAMKYSNRYGYPDGGVTEEIAKHHGVKRENLLLSAGSGEILNVVGQTFLGTGLKVLGVDPTYGSVYSYASGIKSDAIRLPLNEDASQNIPAMVKATVRNYREVGFVYMCNPNNPTGRVVSAREIKELLDGIPEDMPVLIDEAYHHYVTDPGYATSVPYVLEGRNVIIARTFSKIYGTAGLRLGYAIAPAPLIQRMRNHTTGTINALVKHAAVAALKDPAEEARVKKITIDLRKKAVADLQSLGYESIPSEGNFFMVHIKRPVQPVIEEFRKKGVLVGRPFPPMTQHLRVSVGTAEEMVRFNTAFKQIFTNAAAPVGNGRGG